LQARADTLAGYVYRGKRWNPASDELDFGRIERVSSSAFCEVGECERLAAWRIVYGSQSVELCSKHTLATMRNRRIWERL
jgi:hypothetical protein